MSKRLNNKNKAPFKKPSIINVLAEHFISNIIVEIDESKQYTKKLLEKVPLTDIIHIVGMYKMMSMHGLAIVSDKESKKYLHQKIYFPKSELNKFSKVCDELIKTKWLKDYNKKKIINYIKLQMAFSESGSFYIGLHLLNKLFKTRGTPRKNPYLDFLIVSLVNLVRDKTGKPQYKLISKFLYEQGITDEIDYETLRKVCNNARDSIVSVTKILSYPKVFIVMNELQNASPEEQEGLPAELSDLAIKIFNK